MFDRGWAAVAAVRLPQGLPEIADGAGLGEWLPRGSKTLCIGTGIPHWLVAFAGDGRECLVCVDSFGYLAGLAALHGSGAKDAIRVIPSLEALPDSAHGTFAGALVFGTIPWIASDQDRRTLLTSVRKLVRKGGAVFLEYVCTMSETDFDFQLRESSALAGMRVSRWSRISALGNSAFEVAELTRFSTGEGVEHEIPSHRVARIDEPDCLRGLLESCGFGSLQLLAATGARFGATRATSSVLVARVA